MLFSRKGFTLIELLVVVLIIGILAAVAVPQYKKAVTKSRLAEVATSMNTLQKDFEVFLLNNGGWPRSSSVWFMSDNQSELDVPLSCTTQDGTLCYTKLGGWGFICVNTSLSGVSYNYCYMYLNTLKKPDGSDQADSWLKGTALHWYRKKDDKTWALRGDNINAAVLPEVCTWWKTVSPDHRMVTGEAAGPSDACDAYF